MSEIKDRVEYLFSASLKEEPVTQPLGLQAEFKNEVNLAEMVRILRTEGSSRFRFRSSGLCDLTEEFGIVSLTNAFLHSSNPNLDLSGSNPKTTVSIQDPFHFDPIEGVTLLQKPKDITRDVPTYYSLAGEVRQAIAKLDRKNLSEEVCASLDLMQYEDYMFSLEGCELDLRAGIQVAMRHFNSAVFGLIPEDQKFEKTWTSNQGEVVLHSNRPDFIVHGRPASDNNLVNKLSGIQIEP